jgi:hypothetical protein
MVMNLVIIPERDERIWRERVRGRPGAGRAFVA